MALLPILTLLDIAKDATSLKVVDGTGNYSSTNTGGFGSPNPLKTDVTGAILSLYYLSNLNLIPYRLPSTVNLFATNETILANYFGTSFFKDGVYGIKYNLLFNQTANLVYTAGTSAFTLTAASTIFQTAVGFVKDGNSKIYYIDRSKNLTSTGGFVTEVFETSGSKSSFEIVYESDLKILIDKAGDRCLTEDIGIWAEHGCKDDNFRNIWSRFKQRIALKAKFSRGYLYDAHKLAIALTENCDCINVVPCC